MEDVLREGWYNIPLEIVQSLFQEGQKLYYMQMVAQLFTNKVVYLFQNHSYDFVHFWCRFLN
jgi:hypothetical protein